MNANIASKAYAKIGVESGVASADPHKLISMLYQGALQAIANARNSILHKDISAKAAAISKAFMIIDDGLNASLDKKAGGELAENLSSLYDYMVIRLTQANMNNDMAALDEVARLLNELKSAWEEMRNRSKVSSVAEAPHKPVGAVQAVASMKALQTEAITASQPKATNQPIVAPQQRAANKVQMLYGRG